MALGIGANSAIFSVVYGVLLRPLPYAKGDDLLILRQQRPLAGIQTQGFSPLEIDDYRQQSKTLESIVEYHNMWFVLLGSGEPERLATGVVSWNYFDLFGVKPVAGRTFREERRSSTAPMPSWCSRTPTGRAASAATRASSARSSR